MGRRRNPASTDKRRRPARLSPADHGPAERWQHSGRLLQPTEVAGVLAAHATESHRLDYLLAAGRITAREREAGLKLAADFHRAGLDPRVTGRYSPVRLTFNPYNGWDERTDEEEAAYQRWRNALRALGSLGDLVVSLACQEITMQDAALTHARRGLGKLADWYRLPEGETARVKP